MRDNSSIQATIIDFNDSFTYNIASELETLGVMSQIISWENCYEFLNQTIFKERHALILGPGPGNPTDYESIFSQISKVILNPNIFFMGICLGHQIYWKMRGIDSVRSKNPMHGQAIKVELPDWNSFIGFSGKTIFVQRYNSLVLNISESQFIKKFNDFQGLFYDDECLITRFNRGLTYQFHPESVGTSCPSIFFAPLSNFLYNQGYEGSKRKN